MQEHVFIRWTCLCALSWTDSSLAAELLYLNMYEVDPAGPAARISSTTWFMFSHWPGRPEAASPTTPHPTTTQNPEQLDRLTDGSLWHGEQRLLCRHSEAPVNGQTDTLQVEEGRGKVNRWGRDKETSSDTQSGALWGLTGERSWPVLTSWPSSWIADVQSMKPHSTIWIFFNLYFSKVIFVRITEPISFMCNKGQKQLLQATFKKNTEEDREQKAAASL